MPLLWGALEFLLEGLSHVRIEATVVANDRAVTTNDERGGNPTNAILADNRIIEV